MNRDLQRRIRAVSGVTLERSVLRADARLAARIAHLLDTRTKLWETDAPEGTAVVEKKEATDVSSCKRHRYNVAQSERRVCNVGASYLV